MKIALRQQLAQRPTGVRLTTLPVAFAAPRQGPARSFVWFATADVEAAPAAADADSAVPVAPASAAAVPATAESVNPENPSSAPTSSGRSASTVMRVSGDTDSAKAAKFLCIKLQEAAAGDAVRLRATAQMPSLIALKIIAKAQDMFAQSDNRNVVTFQVQRTKVSRRDERELTLFDFYVSKVPADRLNGEYPADRFPMVIKDNLEYSRVAAHAALHAKSQQQQQAHQAHVPVAVFKLDGPAKLLTDKVKVVLNGLSQARRELTLNGMDLTFRLERSVYTVQRTNPLEQEPQQQQQEQDAAPAAATAGAAASAAAAQPQSSSSSTGEASRTLIRPRYLISAFVCEPRVPSRQTEAAPRRGREDSSSRGSGSAASPRASRPGYVEVPAEEWAQLKEQLEVVPHLTEQLQIMTRQHEQLLSLLAAQGAPAKADGQ